MRDAVDEIRAAWCTTGHDDEGSLRTPVPESQARLSVSHPHPRVAGSELASRKDQKPARKPSTPPGPVHHKLDIAGVRSLAVLVFDCLRFEFFHLLTYRAPHAV
ncbi:hypothetical protein GSI_02056 [Ganoderma sinense ZZ0214-1]|uniref:Uncharacterized protein n=1 Tax=Ganoderma sinense ZZ0214-1 TaxID=1077348 RepID=A0A2G8SNJ3_9APHY|nr:hypothetical protein GSI_02056 [Ganoderma sinense ZZ0214-1]